MNTLNVKVQVIREHIEKRPAKEVLLALLHEVRMTTDHKDESELTLYKSRANTGYMDSFAHIPAKVFRGGDLKQILECDTYRREEKDLVCEILAKYAEHIDCEYGVMKAVDEKNSIFI